METQQRALALNLGLRHRLLLVTVVLLALLIGAVLVSASHGPVRIPYSVSASVLLHYVGIDTGVEIDTTAGRIVEYIRLPRILVAALVGMALAMAGATFQALFRNPLAEPGVIGVSAGGALGAIIAIVIGLQHLHSFFLPAMAFLAAMCTALLVYGIAGLGGRFSIAALLLSGVAVTSFLSACISALILFTYDLAALREIVYWLIGGLDSRLWEHVWLVAPPILLGGGLLMAFTRDLNVMMLGDESAQALGVGVASTRRWLLVLAALITGVAVSVSGIIGFVGLIVPHALRLIIGSDYRVLLPASALGGAVFVVVADTIARIAVQPTELRVGMVTAFVGAPFFLYLLYRNRRRLYQL